jgi:hypothetical protein
VKIVNCAVCGVKFYGRSKTTKTCSSACRLMLDRKRKSDWQRSKCMSGAEYRERKNGHHRKWLDAKRASDLTAFREWQRESKRRYMADPANREKRNELARNRYETDLDYREKLKERMRMRNAAPEFRKRRRMYQAKRASILAAVKELGLINIGDLK